MPKGYLGIAGYELDGRMRVIDRAHMQSYPRVTNKHYFISIGYPPIYVNHCAPLLMALPLCLGSTWLSASRQQYRHNAGNKNTIEGAGTTDGSNWQTQCADLSQTQHIGANQYTHGATDIGERGAVFRIQEQCQ